INGFAGNDRLYGREGNDIIYGGDGNDTLDGGTGNDTLEGGAGNDIYVVDSIFDQIIEVANGGTDTVQASVSWTLGDYLEHLTLTGTQAINGTGNALNNTITGNSANNILSGGGGNDSLRGGAGNDTLDGGDGNDTLDGGTGDDILKGGTGNDTYIVDTLGDQIIEFANAGIDTVRSSVSWILGDNLEHLTLTGTQAINGTGNALNNTITGNSANNILCGGAGNDSLQGGAGNDTLDGGDGNDTLDGGTGDDILNGGAGNDTYIVDTIGDQIIEAANAGIDTVKSSVSWILGDNLENLTLTGTATQGTGNSLNNVITGNNEFNTLAGGAGNDTLYGGAGNDSLDGGIGNDTLVGGDWMDFLVGGEGNDTLTGGADQDIFYFGSPNQGTDTITDFVSGSDWLYVSQIGFGGGLAAVLTADQFTLGTAATTTNHRFIYNQGTGALFFDQDGAGGIAQVQIAQLTGTPTLTASDIVIF
ncbi:MAG TPA: calcium-binding protein, partial [Coleofasciculaceae cyanobacterium]